jgi:putative transposase
VLALYDRHPNLVVFPYNTSIGEMLRRPLEFTQYTSYAFGKRCQEMGVMPSVGSVGDAYDNAMAESFFATLEREVLNRRRFKTQAEARMAIFEWLEGWYNPHRRHSSLGYLSPINYERKLLTNETATI